LTCGDWHKSALKWDRSTIEKRLRDSSKSLFGDYGIEPNKVIPENDGLFNVANHIRALLDLLADGNFSIAQGMRDDFICNEDYTDEVFNKAIMLVNASNWIEIDSFLEREYRNRWVEWKGE
jgi:hypothetical protein